MSTPSADLAAGRRRNQTAPSAVRAGWIAIGFIAVMFSSVILATQPGDDSAKSDAGSSAAEHPVPIALRIVANIVGWEQNRHN